MCVQGCAWVLGGRMGRMFMQRGWMSQALVENVLIGACCGSLFRRSSGDASMFGYFLRANAYELSDFEG